MKKSNLFLSILFISSLSFAQVEGVKFMMKSDFYTDKFDVYLKITEGTATTSKQRRQFSGQISIITTSDIVNMDIIGYMPLQGNVNYNSSTPLIWDEVFLAQQPVEDPNHNYFAITPTLSPTSFYNNLMPGDEVKLFTIKLSNPVCHDKIRFFRNGIDMDNIGNGADCSNNFSIGSTKEIFKGLIDDKVNLIKDNILCANSEIKLEYNKSSIWIISDNTILTIENNTIKALKPGMVQVQGIINDSGSQCISPIFNVTIEEPPYLFLSENGIEVSESIGVFKWYECNTNELLKESEDPFFVPPFVGSFYADITTENCNVKTDCLDFLLSGVDNKKLTGFIYPSITSGKIFTEMNEGSYNFEIFDMDGRSYNKTIHQQKSDRESIDLSFLKAGLYLLKFEGKEILSQKVIISK